MGNTNKLHDETVRAKSPAHSPHPLSSSLTATACWLMSVPILVAVGYADWAIAVGMVIATLLLLGVFCPALRSGSSPRVIWLLPLWGVVACTDRLRTSRKLRLSGILDTDASDGPIPASTSTLRTDDGTRLLVVRFDGRGLPGMTPTRIDDLLSRNISVWGCRSHRLSEDARRPGLFTITMSKGDHVPSPLDMPVEVDLQDDDDWLEQYAEAQKGIWPEC